MVRDYNVISKGKYEYKQTNEFLQINRFLIVRKKKRRMLLLDMENISEETLTAMKLQIEQFDVRGKDLGPTTFEMKTSYKKGAFILKNAIELHHSCIDFRVKVVYAEYGNYVYRLGEEDTYVTYEKQKKRKKLSDAAVRKKTGKEGHLEKKRRFKAPVFVGVFATLILAVAAGATFAHLQSYKEEKEQFFLQNLRYEFIDGNKEAGAPVYITGYIGLGGEDILIPNTVEGHPVQGIAQGAFANNTIIETLTVEKGVVISMDAFYNCNSLESITLLGDNVVEDYAFAECDNLEKIKATDLLYAGNGAFANATELKSLRLESTGEDKRVSFGEEVLTAAEEMDEIYIDTYIVYGEKCHYFDQIGSVEKLYLKNMNTAAYSSDGALDKTMQDLFGNKGVDVEEVEIYCADVIPAYLTAKCGDALTEFTVHSLTETTVGEAAFQGCAELSAVNLPKLVTEVGANAFEGTAITSFNALALKKMGVAAFKDCAELSDFQLDVISELSAIPREAFSGCESLTIMYVPAKVEKIGEKAFYECKELETFNFAMDGILSEIDDNAFELCKKLTTLSLPSNLEKIGSQAFKTCNRLNYISIPQSVEMIESDAFLECYRLYEIENLSYTLKIIPGVELGEYSLIVYTSASDARMPRKTVGDYVFGEVNDTWYLLWYLGSESELTLPNADGISNYVVQSYLFIDTEGITQINIPNQASVIGKKVFHESDISKVFFTDGSADLLFTADTFSGCESLVEVDFNARIFETIDAGLFEACSNLEKLGLPKYLTKIGASAFAGCESLVTITGGQGVREIEDSAFNACSSLESFSFGPNLETIGQFAFAGCNELGAFTGATSLVSLGANAFEGCSSLTKAVLPETLTSIGEFAFRACSSLASINIPSRVTSLGQETFRDCSSLTAVSGCGGLTELGDSAFYGCSALKNVAMPALGMLGMQAFLDCSSLETASMPNLVSMGAQAFKNCTSLLSFSIPNSLSIIPESAFDESGVRELTGGQNLTSIGTRAFYNCDRLNSLSIPVNVQTIGMEAFRDCDGLQRLTLNSSLKYIEGYAFTYCDALTSVKLNNGLNSLGIYAFANCSNLQNLTIGDNIGYIGSGAFQECNKLQSVTIGNNVVSIGEGAFTNCKGLQNVTIGENLQSIGDAAFNGCTALSSLDLAYGLERICDSAFMNCTALTSVTLPDSVTYLGASAFENCVGLAVARLSNGLVAINTDTFYGCKQLSKVYLGTSLQVIYSGAFYGCDQLHEVYNFSVYLRDLTINSTSYGYVAYNAIIIHTSENETMSTVSVNNYLFKNSGNTWALVSYTGKDTSLHLGTMSYYGGRITSYEIARYAFKDCLALKELSIGSEVTAIRSQAFNGMSGLKKVDLSNVNALLEIPGGAFNGTNALETLIVPTQLSYMESGAFSNYSYANFRAYFEGERNQWEYSKYNISSSYWYYYDDCIHYDREWNYQNGQINTVKKDFKEKITKQPTCLESGEKLYYCDTCNDTQTSYPSKLGHDMSDYECTRCGYIDNLPVNRNSLAHFREVVTITNKSKNPFDLFDSVSTQIHAPNVYSITSEMTFTAKQGIRLSFIVKVSGDCELVIQSNDLTKKVTDYSYLTLDLNRGETVTFTYTDYRIIPEPEPEIPEDSSGLDSSESSGEDSSESSEPSNDFITNYAEEEEEQFASAYIYQIYVSSLDEKNPV